MAVARVSPLAAPHLKPCGRVPREDSDRMPAFQRLAARTCPVNLVRAFLVGLGKGLVLLFERGPEVLQILEPVQINSYGLAALQEMRVYEKYSSPFSLKNSSTPFLGYASPTPSGLFHL